MKLTLTRRVFTPKSTTGDLSIDGVFFCYTLEDVVRPEGEKVYGQTAIPAGNYKVVLDYSQKFGKTMPHLLDVPDFVGVRIHSGNTDKDTDGCILLGYAKDTDVIYRSKEAFQDLYPKLDEATKNKWPVEITIS